jgi:flagellar biosynthetic protein FlhB
MADEDRDDSQKTEEPSQRRLQEARERGDVPQSREINHWFMVLAIAIAVFAAGPGMTEAVARLLVPFLERAESFPTDAEGLRWTLGALFWGLVKAAAVPALMLVAAAIAGGLIQHGPILTLQPLKPTLDRISPVAGAKRLFALRSVVEFLKGIAKIAIVGAVALWVLWPVAGDAARLPGVEVAALLDLLRKDSLRLLLALLAVMAGVAAVDYLYQYIAYLRRLRMTKQELREELKQSEGDPFIKARVRQIRMERARRRMMAAVPKADVVVTNPTHYAVALKYEPGKMAAPKLVAKGADTIAARIRAVAEEHAVPIVENPPLARTLYAAVDLDEEVPPEHYRAVAEVIGYVMRLKGSRRRIAAERPTRP